MRVLLVQALLGRQEPRGVIFPLGLCYVATALEGHEVRVLDLNLCESPYEELRSQMHAYRPEIVGISLRNIDTASARDSFYYFKTLEPTVLLLKQVDPTVKILIGGSGFSIYAEAIMKRIPGIDFGIFLEGEEATPELLRNLASPESVRGVFSRRNKKAVFSGRRPLLDFQNFPPPRKNFVDVRAYLRPEAFTIGIQTKRGCAMRCTYCVYPHLNGPALRARKAEQVVDEIEDLVSRFNVSRFMFADGVFNVPPAHAAQICEAIVRRKLKVEWAAYFDMRSFTHEFLTLCLESGCKNFVFSPDAASNESLEALGKGISERDISRVMRMMEKTSGVWVEFDCFSSPPGQTFAGFLKTFLLYVKVGLTFRGRGGFFLSQIRIEPHTEICERAIAEGIISEDTELLPLEEGDLQNLFYKCPATSWYADRFFDFLFKTRPRISPLIKKFLRKKAL
jgi:radical SAM superfamily enzyme YgiQ (UPF0313 family)